MCRGYMTGVFLCVYVCVCLFVCLSHVTTRLTFSRILYDTLYWRFSFICFFSIDEEVFAYLWAYYTYILITASSTCPRELSSKMCARYDTLVIDFYTCTQVKFACSFVRHFISRWLSMQQKQKQTIHLKREYAHR